MDQANADQCVAFQKHCHGDKCPRQLVDTVRSRQFNQFKGDMVNCSGSFSKSFDCSKLVI